MTQKSEKFGDQYIYISPIGLKLVSPARGINIVHCGPEWNVALYNDKTRMYYSTNFDKWMADLDRKTAGSGQDMSNRIGTRPAQPRVAGLQATQYTMSGGAQPEPKELLFVTPIVGFQTKFRYLAVFLKCWPRPMAFLIPICFLSKSVM